MKFFIYDEAMESSKAKITTAKLSTMGDIVTPEKQFITAAGSDAPATLNLISDVLLSVGTSIFKTADTTLTAANLDSGTAFASGSDYCIYACDPTSGDDTKDTDEIYKISLSKSYPAGYTADNSRKIGGFHYGIVRRVADNWNPINTSGTENGSGWETNVYTGILPNSVWTILHRPKCDPTGMAYLGGTLWGDIYLSSDDGSSGLQSIFNANPITGTEGLSWYIAAERAGRVGKRLPTYAEFCRAALGSPEGQDGNNTYAWSSTGNTARAKTGSVQNAVSSYNIRDLVGNVWKWLDEFCLDPTAASWAWQDVLGAGYGDIYMPSATALRALIAGGSWSGGARGGRRALSCSRCPWLVDTDIGVWAVCDSQ